LSGYCQSSKLQVQAADCTFIMAGKQAKILSEQQTRSLLVFASASRNPRRNKLILLLSLKAGLRAGEIAKLIFDSGICK
jgi:integrase